MHRVFDSPAHSDSEKDYLECTEILVSAGWELSLRNPAGETPMHNVVRHRQISTIQYLLSQNVSLPSDILLAAFPGDDGTRYYAVDGISLVCFLIHEGASVNTVNSSGNTPLHLALRGKTILHEHSGFCHMESWKLVEILLEGGSDLHAQNVDGQTLMDIAEANGHFFKENFLRLVEKSRCIRS